MSGREGEYHGGTVVSVQQQPGVLALPANPAAISTVQDMRLSEMEGIHRRLGRLCAASRETSFLKRIWKRIEWDRVFGGLAVLSIGAAIGAGIGIIPLLNVENVNGSRSVSDRTLWEYGVAIGAFVTFGVLALLARMAIKVERENSVRDIYEDLGEIVGRYEPTKEQDATTA